MNYVEHGEKNGIDYITIFIVIMFWIIAFLEALRS